MRGLRLGLSLTANTGASLGPNLISNGDFTTDSTGWTLGTGVTHGTGRLNASNAGQVAYQSFGEILPVGNYRATLDYTMSAGSKLRIGNTTINGGGTIWTSGALAASGTIDTGTVAWPESGTFSIEADSAAFSGTIDNITLRQV